MILLFIAQKVEGSIVESTVSNPKAFAIYNEIISTYNKCRLQVIAENEPNLSIFDMMREDYKPSYDIGVEMGKKGCYFENNTYKTPRGSVSIELVGDLNTESTLSYSTQIFKFTITI